MMAGMSRRAGSVWAKAGQVWSGWPQIGAGARWPRGDQQPR